MRPNVAAQSEQVYECYECGDRFEGETPGSCDSCGRALKNIGRSRDL